MELLHSILVIGLYLGLSYEDVFEMTVETASAGIVGCTSIINEAVKTQPNREYTIYNIGWQPLFYDSKFLWVLLWHFKRFY